MDPDEIIARAMTGSLTRDDPPFRVCLEHNYPQAAELAGRLYEGGYRLVRDTERTPPVSDNAAARLVYGYDLGYPNLSGHKLVPTFTVEADPEYDGPVDPTVFDWYSEGDDLGSAINAELYRIEHIPRDPDDEIADDPDDVLRDLSIAVVAYGHDCAGRALITWQSEESDGNGLATVDDLPTLDTWRLDHEWDGRLADALAALRFTVKYQDRPRWLPLPTLYR